jgi:hypothetical protein
MNETQVISEEQRKGFANLIREAQQRVEKSFDSRMRELKDELAPRLEAGTKVRHVIEQIRGLRGKLGEAAEQLRRYGYRVLDDGFVSVDYDATNEPYGQFEAQKRSLLSQRDEMIESCRQSLFDVLSARTPDEAREIVRKLM